MHVCMFVCLLYMYACVCDASGSTDACVCGTPGYHLVQYMPMSHMYWPLPPLFFLYRFIPACAIAHQTTRIDQGFRNIKRPIWLSHLLASLRTRRRVLLCRCVCVWWRGWCCLQDCAAQFAVCLAHPALLIDVANTVQALCYNPIHHSQLILSAYKHVEAEVTLQDSEGLMFRISFCVWSRRWAVWLLFLQWSDQYGLLEYTWVVPFRALPSGWCLSFLHWSRLTSLLLTSLQRSVLKTPPKTYDHLMKLFIYLSQAWTRGSEYFWSEFFSLCDLRDVVMIIAQLKILIL